jgi:UDP-GalNAc:undecaprenyl-phosphate GalNAc-1-phosphate transferase
MKERLKRAGFISLAVSVSLLLLVITPIYLLSGGEISQAFIENDFIPHTNKLIFVLSFSGTFIAILFICTKRFSLPIAGLHSEIFLVNLLGYVFIGLSLSLARIPLYSRMVFLIEFLLSTLLLILFLYTLHRIFPRRIGLLPDLTPSDFEPLNPIQWALIRSPADNVIRSLDGAIIDTRHSVDQQVSEILAQLSVENIPLYEDKQLIESMTGRINLNQLTVTEFEKFIQHKSFLLRKRFIDAIISILLLIPIGLVGILIAAIIKTDSSGPVFYRQTRIGYRGIPFSMIKFRSMHPDLDSPRSQFATHNDQRITRVGRFLRRTRLDELPQFWNVLRGEMSIIGPRPEQPAFAEAFSKTIPFYSLRHTVRPGITGWAQIRHGYAASEQETRIKLEYDFFYIKHISWWRELVIVVATLKTIILGSGHR